MNIRGSPWRRPSEALPGSGPVQMEYQETHPQPASWVGAAGLSRLRAEVSQGHQAAGTGQARWNEPGSAGKGPLLMELNHAGIQPGSGHLAIFTWGSRVTWRRPQRDGGGEPRREGNRRELTPDATGQLGLYAVCS